MFSPGMAQRWVIFVTFWSFFKALRVTLLGGHAVFGALT
jgi:hypothetical protein